MSSADRIAVAPSIAGQMMGRAREFRTQPTPSEERLWSAIRNRQLRGAKFRRQQAIGPFVVDFFCPEHRLIVEVDGPVHNTRHAHDAERQSILEASGYTVVRVSARAVETDMQSVLANIVECLDQSRSPSPRDGEGVGGEVIRWHVTSFAG